MASVDFEARVERQAEAWMNDLDRQLLRGAITQEEYDTEVKAVDKWVRDVLADPYGAIT